MNPAADFILSNCCSSMELLWAVKRAGSPSFGARRRIVEPARLVARRGGERFRTAVRKREVNVLRQGNPTDEGAGVDEDRLAVSEPVAHEPVNGAGDDIRPQAEPPSVLTEPTWGRPIDTTVIAPPEPVKNRWIATWGQVAIILAGLAALVFGVGAVILGGL